MKAAQNFPRMKVVYNNEGCTGKVPAMKVAQKFPKIKVVYNNEGCITKVPTMKARQKRLSENLRL